MAIAHGFGFWLDGDLKSLFHEAPKVVVTAWAPEEFYVPNRFTFEGKLSGGSEVILFYSECGPQKYLEYKRGLEAGKIVIGGLALRTVRHFLNAAGGATHLYVTVYMDIDREMPPGKEEICVDGLEVLFSFSTSDYDAKLEIHGLGDNIVLNTRVVPSLDAWRIYHGALQYLGLRKEEEAEMPEWLERALRE